jgi:hypothetical protein
MPIDRGLFDTIAAEIGGGMSGGLADKIYYETPEHYRRAAAILFQAKPPTKTQNS